MGFEKWMYRNGFGSPGHTARTLVKWYHQINDGTESTEEEDIYFTIYQRRNLAQNKLNNSHCLLGAFLDKMFPIISANDMPLFVFSIETLETKQFRSGISDKNIDLVLEVVREEVEKSDRTLIKLDFDDYRTKAVDFFNLVYNYAESMY